MKKIFIFEKSRWYKFFIFFLTGIFIENTFSMGILHADLIHADQSLTAPNLIRASALRFFPVFRGIKVYPESPLDLEFLIDGADQSAVSKEEASKLVKYFLAAITVPENDIWVNLSPYEKNRVIPQMLGKTDMGQDLLAQDFLLKQLTASLLYPEKETGKSFWNQIYEKT